LLVEEDEKLRKWNKTDDKSLKLETMKQKQKAIIERDLKNQELLKYQQRQN
jgi:hypothetical protein